ncbi:MAG TPA: hypothetical protein VHE35_17520 [Kofleriaceae bacterium]|nr:hypothetical protein [Kofleriaceae bacterium]
MKTFRIILLCLPLLAACGDEGNTADEYDGTWVIASMTMPGEQGPVTVTRDGSPSSLRGDVVFTATGDSTAAMHVRQIPLEDGVPVAAVSSDDLTVAIEGGRWILTDDTGAVSVFTIEHDGDHLTLTLDPDDARNTAEQPPQQVHVMRVPPWTTYSAGAWDLLWMSMPAQGMMVANTCVEVVTGERWSRLQMMIDFDPHLVFRRTMTTGVYSDGACSQLVGMTQSVQTGLAEEEGGTLLRLWGYENGVGEHLAFTMARAGHALTLTRTACLPMPGCDASTPTEVVVNGR